MKKISISKKILVLAILFFSAGFSSQYGGRIHTVTQPNGLMVDVKLWGDQYYLRMESLDGYTLVREENSGYIVYADILSDQSSFIPTSYIYYGKQDTQGALFKQSAKLPMAKSLTLNQSARNEIVNEMRQELGMNNMDTQKGVFPLGSQHSKLNPKKVTSYLILIEFQDVRTNFTREELEEMMNQNGFSRFGNNGSVKDYFLDASNGKLEVDHIVTRFYRTRFNKNHYDGTRDYSGAKEMIAEAVEALDSEYDFSLATPTDSNRVLGFNVLYAGGWGRDWGEGIWPHRGNLNNIIDADGIEIKSYQVTGILGESGTPIEMTMGTYIHENGHLLFRWPDLYDYDYDAFGAGEYCVMSSQIFKNPQPPNPFYRNHVGWQDFIDVRSLIPDKDYPLPSDGGIVYEYRNPNKTEEFFLIEGTQQVNRRADIPDEGAIFWHIDSSEWGTKRENSNDNMTNNSHYMVSVEQADYRFDLERDNNQGAANDLFHLGYRNAFNDGTTPNTRWWNGGNSGLDIYNISTIKDTMTFQVRAKGLDVVLVDDIRSQDIKLFNNGGTLALDILPNQVNFRSVVESGINSVRYVMSGSNSHNFTSPLDPFFAFNNSWVPAVGNYRLIATGYSGGSGGGSVLDDKDISFDIVEQALTIKIVNASNGNEVIILDESNLILLPQLPSNYTIEVTSVTDVIKSISLQLIGPQNQMLTANSGPWYLWGEQDNNISPWTPKPISGSNYQFEIIAFSENDQRGAPLLTKYLSLDFFNQVDIQNFVTKSELIKNIDGHKMSFVLNQAQDLKLSLTNTLGQEVYKINQNYSSGTHEILWPGNLTGIFFVKIEGVEFKFTRRVFILP